MIILKESLGNIQLCKFIGFDIKKEVGKSEENYDDMLCAYLFVDYYDWNIYDSDSGSADDNIVRHDSMKLPSPFNTAVLQYKLGYSIHPDILIMGGVDLFNDEKGKDIRVWMYKDPWNNMSRYEEIKKYLEHKFSRMLSQRIL